MLDVTACHVLVLNRNYEPLSICNARRALCLLYLGKADTVESKDGLEVHSPSLTMLVPSVIKLGQYVRIPAKRVLLSRKNIIKRDGHRCQYCGSTKKPLTVDHIIPKQLGGEDTWENLVCACVDCNNRKGHKTPEMAGMELLRKPKRPNHITYIQQFVGVSDRNWRPYLFLD